MSGGNQMKQVFAACLLASLLAGPAHANEGFTTGIATANIAWAKPAAVTETMGEIANAGFESVRMGLKNPIAGTFRALHAAKAAGLKVLVTVPLIDGAVARKDAIPRARTAHFFQAYGLTDIDPVRYEARLRALLDEIVAEDLPVIGLEIGNELNWSGYNSDLPLSADGNYVENVNGWNPADRARFEAGLDTYADLLRLTRALLAEDPRLARIEIVTAGLADINADFIRRVGASYVAPEIVYQEFAKRGLYDSVDAIGIHLYEPLRNAEGVGDRPKRIAAQLADCGEAGFAGRPCWITEFGAALPAGDCAPADARRIALMKPLLGYLAKAENATRVPIGFYYDWNEDKGFSLKRCGHPTELTHELPRNGAAPDSEEGNIP